MIIGGTKALRDIWHTYCVMLQNQNFGIISCTFRTPCQTFITYHTFTLHYYLYHCIKTKLLTFTVASGDFELYLMVIKFILICFQIGTPLLCGLELQSITVNGIGKE